MKKQFLSQAEQCQLVKNSLAGDKNATNQLLEFMYPFIAKLASEFMRFGCEFEDLVQEGYVGVLYAIPRYRPEFNTKFVTYALPWVLKKIRTYCYEQRMIRIPYLKIKQVTDYQNLMIKINAGEEKSMTDSEMAKYLNITLPELEMVRSLPISLLKFDPYMEMEKETTDSVDDLVIKKMLIKDAVNQLSEEKRHIIIRYYHLDGNTDFVTYGILANELNCSTEWVRQLKLYAERELKQILKDLI